MRLTAICVGAVLAVAASAPAVRAGDLGPIGDGRRAWLKLNCYGCHGNNAGGGMGPNVQQKEVGDVAQAMWGDKIEGGMRSYQGYATNKDAGNISAYLMSIGTPQEPAWLDWWKPVPGRR